MLTNSRSKHNNKIEATGDKLGGFQGLVALRLI
jgi:hypothetical protein